jgi:hypothetical protein
MYEDTRLAIYNYIENNWQDEYPLFADNQGEQQPAGCFGRYSIRPIDSVSMSVGSQNEKYSRVTALLWFQFFGLEANGSIDAMKFGDLIRKLFDEKWVPTTAGNMVRFQRSELTYVGIEPSGRPQWRCTVRYQVDDL